MLLVAVGAFAKIQEGSIKSDKQFVFLSKFCFSNEFDEKGNVTFKLHDVDPKSKNLTVLVYYDQQNSVRY